MNKNFSNIETILSNSSFLVGFITTIYYWVTYIFFVKKEKTSFLNLGIIGFFLINILLIIELTYRWIISGHFPLSSLFESLLFLAWSINSFYIVIEYITKNSFIGILVAPILVCILGFTEFSLPAELQEMKPLVPALQSNWLFMHVSVMILSYASLLIGCLISIVYLVIHSIGNKHVFEQVSISTKKSNRELVNTSKIEETFINQISANRPKNTILDLDLSSSSTSSNSSIPLQNSLTNPTSRPLLVLDFFDNLSYRIIGIGFCFLTLGILSGAVWANETWGTYWSWDPKETWALITWLTFAVYLHTRLLKGWQGVKPAKIATLGFILIWICYLGVNLLGKGLHSYGFFN